MLRARIENSIRSYPLKPSGGGFSFGNALQFDGVNDYVSTSAPVNTPFTVSVWVYPTASNDRRVLTMVDGSKIFTWVITFNSGTISIWDGFKVITIGTFTLNSWLHLVITYTSTGFAFNSYVNSVNTLAVSNAIPSTGTLSFGRKFVDIYGNHFMGKLDEIAIWNTVLTPAQISNLYNSGNGDFATNYQSANLVAYWRMNGTAGDSTAIDEQGIYNGTLNNFDTSTCWVAH